MLSKWFMRNVTTRPVELHFAGGHVVVLAPREVIELTEPDPLCAVLEKRGVLTRHAVPEPTPVAPATRPQKVYPAAEQPKTQHAGTRNRRKTATSSKTRASRHLKGDSE